MTGIHAAVPPPVTIVIEWENAIDVEDEWTRVAMVALERELVSVAARFPDARPRVTYLYDSTAVEPGTIERTIDRVAPRIREAADVEIVAAPGLTYYKLKNFGISRADTELSIMLDSDAAPQPGWLENLVKPFADPSVVVVGGFTVLAYNDLLSRTMALSWFFDLADEREKTARRRAVHVNNCAVRTEFFRAHPFPDLPMFKKQCEVWLKELTVAGHHVVRTADAMTVHAPHPGWRFLMGRAWCSGRDGDVLAYYMNTRGRPARARLALRNFRKKLGKAWRQIRRRGRSIGLTAWQVPAALTIALGFYSITFVAQLGSALTRSFAPMAPDAAIAKARKTTAREAA